MFDDMWLFRIRNTNVYKNEDNLVESVFNTIIQIKYVHSIECVRFYCIALVSDGLCWLIRESEFMIDCLL